jgi:hypothetical protein
MDCNPRRLAGNSEGVPRGGALRQIYIAGFAATVSRSATFLSNWPPFRLSAAEMNQALAL